jgi:hypothetical protein
VRGAEDKGVPGPEAELEAEEEESRPLAGTVPGGPLEPDWLKLDWAELRGVWERVCERPTAVPAAPSEADSRLEEETGERNERVGRPGAGAGDLTVDVEVGTLGS